MKPAHVRKWALHTTAYGNEFRCNGDRDFFRSDRADVEADGSVHTLEKFCGETFLLELAKDGYGFALRTDHPNVAGRRLHGPAENAHIVAVSTCHDYDVFRVGGREFCHCLIEVFRNYFASFGKTLAVRVKLAVIDDDRVESSALGGFIKGLRDVTCAENIKYCLREDWLDEDVERATANQPCIVLGVLIEIEGKCARFLLLHDFASRLPNVGFNAAAPDRAKNRAVIPDQHLGGLVRRYGAADIHDRGDGAPPAFAAEFDNLLVDVHEADYFGSVRASQTGTAMC